MKLTKYFAGLALGVLLFTACKDGEKTEQLVEQGQNTTATAAVTGQLELASFEVEGMTCALGCAKLIESKLAALDGVKSAKVDFETKQATVSFDDAKQNSESLTKTVEKIANGIYKVSHFEAKKVN
ncbi:heavy-metal-associated domain-containing protein [Flavobacterium sp. JP2137]|uniref:heavy-metal-associated domain-containing protein n=1 Tax=Flavobacterium sp. JP2137 TaxID=3414510 RepID=UPI003D2FC6D1